MNDPWIVRAERLVLLKASYGRPFLLEDVRIWAEFRANIPPPPDPRMWSNAVQRVARRGLIRKLGMSRAGSGPQHRSMRTVWVKT